MTALHFRFRSLPNSGFWSNHASVLLYLFGVGAIFRVQPGVDELNGTYLFRV